MLIFIGLAVKTLLQIINDATVPGMMMNPGKQTYRAQIRSLWIWVLLVAVLMAVIVPGAQAALSENRTRAYHNFFTDRTGLEPDLNAELHWVYGNFYDDFAPGSLVAAKSGPSAFKMFRNALQPFKGQNLTNVGRALTKHPEVIGQTKQALRQALRTDQAINKAAANSLKDIMRTGTRTMQNLPRYGSVVQYQKAGSFGARFSAETGEFIGFINP